jgi:hypothetical protein
MRTSSLDKLHMMRVDSRDIYGRTNKLRYAWFGGRKMIGTLVAGAPTGLQIKWKGLELAFFLLLVLPALASAQSDPLSPSNMPAIDTNPADYPSNIWVTDTMQKVRQDAGSPGSLHWGTFYGTQNEFVDFQVHVQASAAGIPNLVITCGNFVNSKTGTTISATSNNIIVYREAYINVNTQVTSVAATYYNALGYYPDPLIPTIDPYHGQTTNAWPFTVAPNQNQSAWIDVHIPSNAPSGYYLGSVTVKSGSTTLATLPVIIGVWQWPSSGHMPSTSTLAYFTGSGYADMCNQAYGSYSACSAYPGAGGNSDAAISLIITADFGLLMLDHRISSADPLYPPPTTTFSSFQSSFGPLFNGTASTLLSGAKLTTAQYAWGNGQFSYLQNWATEFNTQGWLPHTYFNYTCDEPPATCAWSNINTRATSLHATTPPTPSLVTTDLANATTNGVLNSIDIMVPIINALDPQGGSLQRSAYNTWLSGSSGPTRVLWSYQSCSSSGTCGNGVVGPSNATWPNYNIDGKPAANRAMEWLSYRNGVTGELYFASTYCWQYTNCSNGSTAGSDPWVDAYSFGGWGSGTFFYPGTTAKLGAGVTTPFYVGSVRLKHIRDGMQDYEYLNALNAAGQGSVVTTQINSWITSSSSFETTGAGFQKARTALGTALHQLTYSGTLSPPVGLTATVQ